MNLLLAYSTYNTERPLMVYIVNTTHVSLERTWSLAYSTYNSERPLMVYIVNTTHISLEKMWHGWSWCERLFNSSFGAAKIIENHSVLCYLMMVRIPRWHWDG